MTTVYQTSVSDCGEPAVCCQSPDPCCPPMVVGQSSPSVWQRLGLCGGSSQASYRTSWKKVPVTSYRPVVSTDPLTGCPTTVMKPCTTYEWQPERQRCGLFDRLLGRCDAPPPQVQCCVPSEYVNEQLGLRLQRDRDACDVTDAGRTQLRPRLRITHPVHLRC